MKRKIFLIILIFTAFVQFSLGEKKEEKASTHHYDSDINIYEIKMGKNKKFTEKNKVASEFVRLYEGSPQKFYYKKINLNGNLIAVIKADMLDLLMIDIYNGGKLVFKINEKKADDMMENHFSFKFKVKGVIYLIEIKSWLGYTGDFGHGSSIGLKIYKEN